MVRQNGEVMKQIALAFMGIVVVYSLSGCGHEQKKSTTQETLRRAAAFATLANVNIALEAYVSDCGNPPRWLSDLSNGSNASGWKGPYLKIGMPMDPWGSPLNYCPTNGIFVLWSSGPDKAPNTLDDVFNGKQFRNSEQPPERDNGPATH